MRGQDDEESDHQRRQNQKNARVKIRKADFLQRRAENPMCEHESETRKPDWNIHERDLHAKSSRKKGAHEFFYWRRKSNCEDLG